MSLSRTQMEKYADILIWGMMKSRKKLYRDYDRILVRYDPESIFLLEILYPKLLERKWHVTTKAMMTPSMESSFFSFTDARQRRHLFPGDDEFYRNLNGNIYLHAPSSLTHLKNVDTYKINEVMVSRKKYREIMTEREQIGNFGWTLCTYPTAALAKQAGITLKEYAAQIIRACYLSEKEPVKKWEEIYTNASEIKKWINSLPIKSLFIESKNMDLKILLGEKRKFIGLSGHNIPSFEIFTSPDFRGTEGTYFADQPSYRSGNLVEGVTLVFSRGKAVKASARRGDSFLKKMVAMDAGASRVGEFSLTDKRFSRINRFMADTLFDENYGGNHGNCHLALGSSYADTYGGNQAALTKELKKELGYNDSALHWDLVNTEKKTVHAEMKNGKKMLIYDGGIFRY